MNTFLLVYADVVYGQDEVLYFGSDKAFVHAVDGGMGTAVWRTQLEGVFNAPHAELTPDATTAYFQGNDNRLYALDLASDALRWQTAPQRFAHLLGGNDPRLRWQGFCVRSSSGRPRCAARSGAAWVGLLFDTLRQ